TLDMLSYLKSLKIDFEIIICVNNSIDKTEEISRLLSKKHKEIRYLSIQKKGFGLALKEGIKSAKKGLITYIPADNEADKHFIEMALKQIKDYDVILGSRYLNSHRLSTNPIREFLSRTYAKIIKIIFSCKITEFGTIKMFKTEWVKKVMNESTSTHWDFQVEMLYFALRDKKKIKEIPLKVNYQTERESTVNLINDITSLFLSAVKYGFKLRIHQLFH
ncbi:glycosyltransferase family 2 protein, partial [Candidatus Woesearchaeota archaeon]|nr:glycosyltransferase family 2 protein [Candidatus Woesearchaeota archaeon]